MALRLVEDLGAPAAVVVIDLTSEAMAPDWNEWLGYISAAGGYASAMLNWGGDFMKNFGIAAFPWAAKNIYNRVRGTGAVTANRQMTLQRTRQSVSRYPAPAYSKEFQTVRLD